MSTPFGSLIIRMEAALAKLDFKDDAEREAFIRRLADGRFLDRDLQVKLLTFRCNRRSDAV